MWLSQAKKKLRTRTITPIILIAVVLASILTPLIARVVVPKLVCEVSDASGFA